ncbi:MAG TPA: M20/M25/M40 family metallo-hydrolase [Allosphingosinicella sp.]|jgi:acetylornithine deacetylase/succinyl-diaminopimelate desuccinylase-like protein|uniref:M20/M25/M40 family metallo-hydrolase n=1 Tax=Allosphingosinicella sp. TaxID=2823234 RepID=UPI002F2AEE16
MKAIPFLAALALIASPASTLAQATPARANAAISRIVASAEYKKAAAALDAGHARWVEDVIAITEIPAPPFKEQARAKAYLAMFQARGLSDTAIDAEGNVLGLRKGAGEGPLLVVSAHLDTVFPEGTNVKVRREPDKLHAPGVGDDSAGLATQLALIDAMNAAGIRTRGDILFVGTVGEEGLGDLRGVRYLFTKGKYKDRAKAFISIDGVGSTGFTTGGTGSKRYRLTFKGPGGHSSGAFGIVNPMAALSQSVVDLYKLQVPSSPRTTFSASVVGGGTSVNAIPEQVWLEVDMRSDSAAELARLEQRFLGIVDEAVKGENAARSTRRGSVSVERKPIGDRPAGQTPASAEIVQLAMAAHRAEGVEAQTGASSTDANIPMSMGVPAITMSGAAAGAGAHAPDEWVGVDKPSNVKLKRIRLATILALAGIR